MMGYALTLRRGSLKGYCFALSKNEVKQKLLVSWSETSQTWAIVPAMQRADGFIKIIG